MENYTPLLQRLTIALELPLTNNSYIWSLAGEGIPEDFKGSVLQYIIETQELEEINGNNYQTLALSVGATEPVNGSWLQAIVEKIEA
jgi:hypothetical protein